MRALPSVIDEAEEALRSPVERYDPARVNRVLTQLANPMWAHTKYGGICLILICEIQYFQYDRTRDPQYLTEAVQTGQRAVKANALHERFGAQARSSLGDAWRRLAEHTRNGHDFDAAIGAYRQAAQAPCNRDPSRPIRLTNLASALAMRFECTGAPEDLEEALRVGRQAIDATRGDSTDRATCLGNLGNFLTQRFQRIGAAEDLDRAIDTYRRAIQDTGEGAADRARLLSCLGIALRNRYELTSAYSEVLDEAINLSQQAVDLDPSNHRFLTNLGNALILRWQSSEADTDLDRAITVSTAAVSATPHRHIDLHKHLTNLSDTLLTRYLRHGAIHDLDLAIQIARRAVAATPEGHSHRAATLNNLSNALVFSGSGLSEALRGWSEACDTVHAPITTRLRAAISQAFHLGLRYGPAVTVDAYASALELLPLLAWRGLRQQDQHQLLRSHAEPLAREGAGSAVAAGVPDRAIAMLEVGRGIYWNQLLDTRTDLTAVRDAAPNLATKLEKCRTQLDQHTASSTGLEASRSPWVIPPEAKE
ncbi:hypothetical protein GCM10010112_22600 [Actinoplanes lobatus]|uniref:Tetratricopeptide (TPR) repeat protein n=1 Tax=Actinoplanes lobatus TaxID=113568 RepID=A0A7W7HIS5_9ACTN|nr:tetratricopeptide repeat protein [Actinoplanes lobatus]MBB4751303.1 tetratricopeptide (TPR) repeat protein [Actinoplanes lobatus]GGN63384.1 hypothetical protein GCM10010112_22600 [Actinoplanes lobatus]GIE44755.1 hypothetical protein Alo02nite_76530 [Actinoplanes lobatus]